MKTILTGHFPVVEDLVFSGLHPGPAGDRSIHRRPYLKRDAVAAVGAAKNSPPEGYATSNTPWLQRETLWAPHSLDAFP